MLTANDIELDRVLCILFCNPSELYILVVAIICVVFVANPKLNARAQLTAERYA